MKNLYSALPVVLLLLALPLTSGWAAEEEAETADSPAKIELLIEKDIRMIEAERLVREEKYVDALLLIEKIISADARTDKAYTLSAYAYMKLDKLDKARQTLVNALRLSPRSRAAQNYAGRLALLNDNPRDAKQNLDALKTVCGGTDCAEYRDLEYRIKEYELSE